MKKMKNMAGALGLALSIVLALAACPTGSSGGGGETTYYYSSDYLAEYKLAITKAGDRAAFEPQAGDRYVLQITFFADKRTLTSSGTVAQAAGGALTLSASSGGGTFTVTVNSDNAGITEINNNQPIPVQGGTYTPSGSMTSGKPTSKNILIGIAMPETHVERWVGDGNALKNVALSLGYKADLRYANGNQDTQNTQIKALMDAGAKLIIVANVNATIGTVVTEAKTRGVTIIAYDRLIQNSSDYDYYVTFNNIKVGQMQGQSIIDGLSGSPKNIVLFAGSSTDKNAEFFFNEAMKVLQPKIGSGLTVIDGKTAIANVEVQDWWAPNAKVRMDGITWANVDAVLAPNDSIARYIIDNYPAVSGKIITGQDAEFESAKYIKAGKQYMTVFKDTRKLAGCAVTLADQILQGKTTISLKDAELATAAGGLDEMGNNGMKKVNTYILNDVKVIKKDNLQDLFGYYSEAQYAQLK
jgi:putative multiple sugar transport system substrate-binding protein